MGRAAPAQRSVSTLLGPLVEKGKTPVGLGRETKRDLCPGEESRRGTECMEAAGAWGEEDGRL